MPSDADPTMREAIEAAIAQHSEEPAEAAPVEPVEQAPEGQGEQAPEPGTEVEPSDAREGAEAAAGPDRDEKGRFKPKGGAEKPAEKPSSASAAAQPASAEPKPGGEQAPQRAEPARAPQSWRPDAREAWAKLPPRVQEEVTRREREMAQAMQESADARKGWGRFAEVSRPYEAMMRANGHNDPVAVADGLFRTAAALQIGTPETKAQIIARTIMANGVDVELLAKTLEQFAAGGGVAPPPTGGASREFRDPRVDALEQRFQQAMLNEERVKVETFAKDHEFFEDVRQDMAGLMAMRRQQGLTMSLQDAYDAACRLHPEIQAALAQRQAARAATTGASATARARAAASSVRTHPAPASSKPRGESVRDDIQAAIEKLQSA